MQVTVVFPVSFNTEAIDGFEQMTLDEKKEAILDYADYYIECGGSEPIIQDSEDAALID
jgi:hypothetical protein